MIFRLTFLASCLFAAAGSISASVVSADVERQAAGYLLAFGRPMAAGEGAGAADTQPGSLETTVSGLRARLQNDATAREAVARKAFHDVYGRNPASGELATVSGPARVYVEQIQEHLNVLAANKAEYRAVIERAYERAASRHVHDIEYAYWEQRDPVPFMLLVACIEHWAQRNAPGLMSTTGEPSISIHSTHLHTARLSPAMAAEARAIASLPALDSLSTAREQHVIAPGAAGLVAVGGIHFVVAGRP